MSRWPSHHRDRTVRAATRDKAPGLGEVSCSVRRVAPRSPRGRAKLAECRRGGSKRSPSPHGRGDRVRVRADAGPASHPPSALRAPSPRRGEGCLDGPPGRTLHITTIDVNPLESPRAWRELTTPSIVRQLGALFDGGSAAGLSDRQLIERFVGATR